MNSRVKQEILTGAVNGQLYKILWARAQSYNINESENFKHQKTGLTKCILYLSETLRNKSEMTCIFQKNSFLICCRVYEKKLCMINFKIEFSVQLSNTRHFS